MKALRKVLALILLYFFFSGSLGSSELEHFGGLKDFRYGKIIIQAIDVKLRNRNGEFTNINCGHGLVTDRGINYWNRYVSPTEQALRPATSWVLAVDKSECQEQTWNQNLLVHIASVDFQTSEIEVVFSDPADFLRASVEPEESSKYWASQPATCIGSTTESQSWFSPLPIAKSYLNCTFYDQGSPVSGQIIFRVMN